MGAPHRTPPRGGGTKPWDDESAGPLAQIIPYPRDAAGDGGDDDQLAPLKKPESPPPAVRRFWSRRPPPASATARRHRNPTGSLQDSARCHPRRWCLSPITRSAGCWRRADAARLCSIRLRRHRESAKRLRQWHLGTVAPLAKMLEYELSEKLEARVRFRFDGYPRDMVSRATVTAKLAGVEGMSRRQAARYRPPGLLQEDIDDD